MKQDKWINKLRNRMNGYSEPVPDDLWSRLEKELKTSNSVELIPWWKRWQAVAAVITVVIVCSITGWFMFNDEQSDVRQVSENIPFTSAKQNENGNQVLQDGETPLAEKEINQLGKAFPTDKQVRRNAVTLTRNDDVAVGSNASDQTLYVERDEDSTAKENEVKEETVSNTDKKEEKQSVIQINPQSKQQAYASRSKSKNYIPAKKKKINRWSVALGGGNTPLSYSNISKGFNSLESNWIYQDNVQLGMISKPDDDVITYDGKEYKWFSDNLISVNARDSKNEYTNIEHKAPITFGLSARYALNQDWSVESGLFYTMLNSELTSGTKFSYKKEEQRLHYIGIPLKLNRIIWGNEHFDVYASAGGAVEKCVKGQLEVKSVYGEEVDNGHVQNVDIDKLQWSVSASIGTQYKLIKELAIYVEPGIVHYFDDGADVQTIRKKHPTNFNLSVGFRLNLGK